MYKYTLAVKLRKGWEILTLLACNDNDLFVKVFKEQKESYKGSNSEDLLTEEIAQKRYRILETSRISGTKTLEKLYGYPYCWN